jgi:hypothetical protein
MINSYLLAGLAAAVLTLAGCAKNSPPSSGSKAALATVNGKPVNADAFEFYVAAVTRKPAGEATPEVRAQILDQYIAMQLAADLAVKNGMERKRRSLRNSRWPA